MKGEGKSNPSGPEEGYRGQEVEDVRRQDTNTTGEMAKER